MTLAADECSNMLRLARDEGGISKLIIFESTSAGPSLQLASGQMADTRPIWRMDRSPGSRKDEPRCKQLKGKMPQHNESLERDFPFQTRTGHRQSAARCRLPSWLPSLWHEGRLLSCTGLRRFFTSCSCCFGSIQNIFQTILTWLGF